MSFVLEKLFDEVENIDDSNSIDEKLRKLLVFSDSENRKIWPIWGWKNTIIHSCICRQTPF
jgi:hypothetical protein